MLTAFNMLLASAVVLAFLVWVIALPFFAAWWLLSVRKSLATIAFYCEFRTKYERPDPGLEEMHDRDMYPQAERSISTSAFGR